MYDIAIVGAGASGLMCASVLKNKKVAILDNNKTIAKKIQISGGGKCNITNKYMNSSHFLADKKFVDKVFARYSTKDLLNYINSYSIYPKLNPKIVKGTYFCNSSEDVINFFRLKTSYAKFFLDRVVEDIYFENGIFFIKTSKNTIKASKVVVASGGLSYTSLGASDIGLKIASKFGHNIIKPAPALVGFTVQKEQFWFKELSGLSMEVKITIKDKVIYGKMLFTHKGCSGPAILTTSLYWQKGSFSIDFSPYKDSYLPKRFRQIIKDKNIDIHNYTMSPAGTFGYTKAEVTKGGIDTKDITSEFESKFQKGLYFVGEVLDVTGELGGYNLQWAFSSGYICGINL